MEANKIKKIVSEVKTKLDNNGGLEHVYFIALGGSKAAIFPGLYLLQSEATSFGATTYTSNEFVHATPKELGKRSLAIICSLKATAESIEAVKVANKACAVTIALTGSMETGMAQIGQYVITYSNGDDQVYSDSNQSNVLMLGFEILHQFEQWANYEKAMNSFQYIDEIISEGKDHLLADSKEWAKTYKDAPVFYVLASGSNYGVAYSMCMCHFMEMQWKHAVCIHSGEYFHGPFETTDENLPMVLLMSEGRTRALDERVLTFLKKYANNYKVIDFKELNKGRIDKDVVEFFNPVVMIPIERYYVYEMSLIRDHDMDYRRYMWKVEY